MTVLVTGASGYLGRHVVRQLAATDIPVVAQVRNPQASPTGTAVAIGDSTAAVAIGDLCDTDAVRRILATHRPHTVIHCAAHIPRTGRDDEVEISLRDNVTATETLLDACREYEIRRVVYSSTISVYTRAPGDGAAATEADPLDPQGFYGAHKLAGEALCQDWCGEDAKRTCVILRFSGIHGGGRRSGVVYAFLTAAMAGEPVSVGSPDSRLSLLNVEDAGSAACIAATRPPGPGVSILNIAGAETISLKALALDITAMTDSNSEIIYGESPARTSALAIGMAQSVLGFNPAPLHSWLAAERDLLSRADSGKT